MITSKKIFILLLVLIPFLGFSQQNNLTVDDILKKVENNYLSQDYISKNSKYVLYLDHKSNKVHEQYNGMILKKNNVNYFKIKNTEFVSFDIYGIKVNNDEKAFQIEKAAKSPESSPILVSNYLKVFQNKSIKNDKDYYICELKPGKISQIMFSKVLVYIKKTDYSIAKQIFYYVEKMESKDNNNKVIYTTPRLEITISPRTKDAKKDSELVKRENYFSIQGNKINVSKKFATYKIYKS